MAALVLLLGIGMLQTQEAKPSFATQVEKEILVASNAERTKANLPKLEFESRLAQAARGHSQAMLDRDFFSHESPIEGRKTMPDRVRAVGYDYRSCAENIAMFEGLPLKDPAEVAKRFVRMWMNSAGHRKNLLGDYRHLGVGVAIKGGKAYATQVFGTSATASGGSRLVAHQNPLR